MKSAVDFAILICSVIQLQPPNAAQYSLIPLSLILIYTIILYYLYYSANKSPQLEKQREKKSGDTHTFVYHKSYLKRN